MLQNDELKDIRTGIILNSEDLDIFRPLKCVYILYFHHKGNAVLLVYHLLTPVFLHFPFRAMYVIEFLYF